MQTLRLPTLSALLLALGGCGPVYELRDHYSPPLDRAGQECIRGCETQRNGCRLDCDRAYSSCAREADTEAKEAYSRALEVYAAEIETYGAEQALYDREYQEYRELKAELDDAYDRAKQRCRQREPKACGEEDRLDDQRDRLRKDYYGTGGPLNQKPEAPDKPDKPSLSEETDRFRALRCDSECGCQESFKACYIGCGGQVETLRYCVENCDE
jgi:hypothetical protein